jgi:predicted HNH restriction endonuclease
MANNSKLEQIVATAIKNRDARERDYRAQSLKIHPWICARCGREFSAQNLYELTVHHKDHNHENNPPDGSNWENLCIYCHDNEHARYVDSALATAPEKMARAPVTQKALAGMSDLLKEGKVYKE